MNATVAVPLLSFVSIDLAVLVIYIALIVAVGVVFSRYMRSTRDLFAAGGNAPWWMAGISSYMTFFSAGTFVVWGSIAYVLGWVAITIQWVIVVGTLVATIFFAHRWKRAGVDSPIQFLEERFSGPVRQLYVWVRLPFGVLLAAQATYSIAVLVHHQIDVFSLDTVIVIIVVVLVLYTVLGGLWAVLTTDLLQCFVLTFVTILALPIALKAAGGLQSFVDNAPKGFFQLAQDAADYAQPNRVKFTWSYFFWWTIFQTFFICTLWEFIQRFQSCRSERDAKRSGFLVAGMYVIMPIFWLVPLMVYRVINPAYYNPTDPLATKQAEVVYVGMCQALLPAGLTGLALAAMISATVSSVSAGLNVMSAVATRDFYARLFRKNASERELVLAGRIILLLLGTMVALVACRIKSWGGVVEFLFAILPIMIGPMAVPFLWGVVSRRTNAAAVWWAVLLGIGSSLIVQFVLPNFGFEVTLAGKLMASLAVPFTVLLVCSVSTHPSPKEQRQIDAFFARMKTPLQVPPRRTRADYRPIGIVGLLTGGLGVIMLQLLWFVEQQRWFILLFCLTLITLGTCLWLSARFAGQRDGSQHQASAQN